MRVVNRRTYASFNNHACVSNKGKCVVDNNITDHDTIHMRNNFKAETRVDLYID